MQIFIDLKRNIKKLTLQNGAKYSVLYERADHHNSLDKLKLSSFSHKSDLIKFLLNLNIVVSNQEKEKIADDVDKKEEKKVGRNEKCPCGSGKKFKYCHGNI